jgi:hypothetical protein
MPDQIERALPGLAGRQLRLRGSHRAESLLPFRMSPGGFRYWRQQLRGSERSSWIRSTGCVWRSALADACAPTRWPTKFP